MWSSMLDSVASGKKLPEKNILVLGMFLYTLGRRFADAKLGGTPESQREFLEALSLEDGKKGQDRHASKQAPIANNFALGYTYQDVLDADHEGNIPLNSFIYILIYSRHPRPPLNLPPWEPVPNIHTTHPTIIDPSNHPKHTHCRITRLVTTMVLASRTTGLDQVATDATYLAGQ